MLLNLANNKALVDKEKALVDKEDSSDYDP